MYKVIIPFNMSVLKKNKKKNKIKKNKKKIKKCIIDITYIYSKY